MSGGHASVLRGGLRLAAALLAGFVFGLGLALAQMINPRKVLAFLDLAGAWDPSLVFVLGGAVMLAAVGFRGARALGRPRLDADFRLPATRGVDISLLAGAAIFGAGWGLAGYCPGPAVSSLAYGNPEALWFVPAMLVGAAGRRWQLRQAPPAAAVTE